MSGISFCQRFRRVFALVLSRVNPLNRDIPLAPRGERLMSRWTYVIGTKAVAQWACIASSRMATDLMEKAPPGGWKQTMESYFLKPFSARLSSR